MKASTITNKSGWRIQIGTVLLLLLIWQGMSMYFSALLIPSPVETLFAVFHMIKSGELLGPLLLSGGRMLIGFFTGMGIAITCGVLAGYFSWLYEAFRPVVSLILGIPPIILVVLAMVWFGTGGMTPILVIAVLVFPTFFLNTANGWRAIDRQLLEMAAVYRCSKFTVLRQIILPSLAVPVITAISLAAGSTIRIGVMAELLGSDSGIGASLALARININTDKVFAWTLVSIVLIFLIERFVIEPMKKSAFKWQKKAMENI